MSYAEQLNNMLKIAMQATDFHGLAIQGMSGRTYTETGEVYFQPVQLKPKANCRNCGAANHKPQCEYCGTEG